MNLGNILSKKNKVLLKELVVTDFKLRYQDSILGYAWSILKPLFLFIILYVVFDRFFQLGRTIEHFPVYLLLGIVLWNFFQEATSLGLNSIVGRGDLIRKINFPKYIIVISGTVSSLINLGFNLVVVMIFMIYNGVTIGPNTLMVIPLIAELYILSLAIAFFLAALNVKFRDTGYIWEILMQAAFYATPVIYPLQMVFDQWPQVAKVMMINPIAQIIQDARHFLVTDQTLTIWSMMNGWKLLLPFLIILLLLFTGSYYFKKHSKFFAEEI